jgi:hypothetical protein
MVASMMSKEHKEVSALWIALRLYAKTFS